MKVLIIDDEATIREFLVDFMKTIGDFDVQTASNGEAALASFDSDSPNIILLDIHLPEWSGLELLRIFKERGGTFEIIIMTGKAQIEDTLTAIKYGAYDFILKPFNDLSMLERAVRRAAETIKLKLQNEELLAQLTQKNLELEVANRRFEKLSITDDLTGLYNMRYMNEFVSREVSRCMRYGRKFSFIVSDLDNLKVINDANGHLAGSRIIQETGNAIRAATRRTDTVARFGGDEFLIMADEAGISSATSIAERIRQRVESIECNYEGRILKTTASLGVASFPDNGTEYQEL
ncbi:MAG: diguanylate cyclase, partial [Myxococcota bacterium]